MKYLQLMLLLLFSNNSHAQQHLTNGWSLSGGTVLNAKGGNATIHYHLNSFDELRLNYGSIRQNYTSALGESLALTTTLLSISYAAGFKHQYIPKAGLYLGAGAFWEKEKMNTDEVSINNIAGIHILNELEYAPFQRISLLSRLKLLIPFTLKRSKTLRVTFGTRFYF